MPQLTEIYNAAGRNEPIGPLDLVYIQNKDHTQTLISADYIREKGRVPNNPANTFERDYTVNWKANDSFTRVVKQIEQNVAQKVGDDSEMQGLLNKEFWSKEDGMRWEEKLSQFAAEEIAKIPGFEYRTKADPNAEIDGEVAGIERYKSLNKLSIDLDARAKNPKAPYKVEFDCEAISVVTMLGMKAGEDILKDRMAGRNIEPGNYKKPAEYYYATGGATDIESRKGANWDTDGHAWVVSGRTANVVDGTYTRSKNPNSTFEDWKKNKIFVSEDGSTYGLTYKKGAHIRALANAERASEKPAEQPKTAALEAPSIKKPVSAAPVGPLPEPPKPAPAAGASGDTEKPPAPKPDIQDPVQDPIKQAIANLKEGLEKMGLLKKGASPKEVSEAIEKATVMGQLHAVYRADKSVYFDGIPGKVTQRAWAAMVSEFAKTDPEKAAALQQVASSINTLYKSRDLYDIYHPDDLLKTRKEVLEEMKNEAAPPPLAPPVVVLPAQQQSTAALIASAGTPKM